MVGTLVPHLVSQTHCIFLWFDLIPDLFQPTKDGLHETVLSRLSDRTGLGTFTEPSLLQPATVAGPESSSGFTEGDIMKSEYRNTGLLSLPSHWELLHTFRGGKNDLKGTTIYGGKMTCRYSLTQAQWLGSCSSPWVPRNIVNRKQVCVFYVWERELTPGFQLALTEQGWS